VGDDKKPLSQTLCQVGERNGASPDDFTKCEVAKIAKTSSQIEMKMLIGWLKRNTETIRSNEKDVNQSRQYQLEKLGASG